MTIPTNSEQYQIRGNRSLTEGASQMRVFEQATKFSKLAGVVLLLMVASVATSWAQFTAPVVPPAPAGKYTLVASTYELRGRSASH